MFYKILISLLVSLVVQADPVKLRIAIEMDDVSTVKRMVNSGNATVDDFIETSGYSRAPLLAVAARNSSEKVLNYLIASKANLNALTDAGETALMLAVFFPEQGSAPSGTQDRMAKSLIDAGANLENPGNYAPVAYASYSGRMEIIKYMISRGALVDGDIVDGKSVANTGLMMAAMQGHRDVLKFLLVSGAQVKLRSSVGNTAAMLAKKYQHPELNTYLQCAEQLADGEKYADHCPH